MTRQRSLLALALGSFLALSVSVAQSWAQNIGFVNMDQVVSGYDKAQILSANIRLKEAELQKQRADIMYQLEMSRKANAKSPVANSDAEKQMQDRLRASVNEFKDWSSKQQKDLEIRINNAIKTVAKAKAMDMVLSQGVIFVGGTDLTPDVVNTLNKEAN